jgi:hypothetical protein
MAGEALTLILPYTLQSRLSSPCPATIRSRRNRGRVQAAPPCEGGRGRQGEGYRHLRLAESDRSRRNQNERPSSTREGCDATVYCSQSCAGWVMGAGVEACEAGGGCPPETSYFFTFARRRLPVGCRQTEARRLARTQSSRRSGFLHVCIISSSHFHR